jgi:predicted alpha-1,2-mannosidase
MKSSIRTISLLAAAGCFLTSCTSHPGAWQETTAAGRGERHPLENLTSYAHPMCGTGDDANLYPGATAPFGMIQWSPDTGLGLHMGGYFDLDTTISDFSVDHISGAGCSYGGDFAMMPILGGLPAAAPEKRNDFAASFSHANETARPGYYGVTLDNGIKVELTATTRSGFGRFTFPGEGPATMMINAGSDINGPDASGISLNPATHEITGWCVGGHFCHGRKPRNGGQRGPDARTIYFYAVFNCPFTAYSTWSDGTVTPGATNGTGISSGAFVTFDTSDGRTVLAKVGISYVSTANAKANVEAESPLSEFSSEDFDRTVAAMNEVWNRWLNKIQITGGTEDERVTFYSMLYHTLLGPIVVSDANGQYFGYDGRVHTVARGHAQYGVFSGWDIYRSECQWLAMLAPNEASDMAQSLLVDYQQGGTFPRWGVMTMDSGVMMGDPAAAMIADFYAFGARNFDARAALKGLVRAATDPTVYAPRSGTYERDALEDYLKLGYVPEHQKGGYGNVSMTLEYNSADFALSQFAAALGDQKDSAMLLQHAQNWKNHFNPASGYLEMRRRDGSWAPGFANNVGVYDHDRAYVEGTAGQYLWMVPFNYRALGELLGGPAAAAQRLDAFFTKLNVGDRGPDAWMCWLGNEPCLETPWIYDFWGQPWKTQATVRRAMNELYSASDAGYPGNDDVGEMSSWWLFAALGMYPELPGSDVLVLGSPLFPKTVLHLPHGDVTIIAHGAAKDAPYVQSLTVNGQPWNKPWIRYTDISRGGTLIYDLGTAPNTNWGSNLADAPPSYDDGK